MGFGGAIAPEDKPFINEWFPKLLANGLVGRQPSDYERSTINGWFPKLAEKNDWMKQ